MLVIGLMSGTSADGVDAALVEWPDEGASARPFRLIAALEAPIEPALQARIHALAAGGGQPGAALAEMSALDRILGERFAAAAAAVCQQAGVPLAAVRAVASHGQTIAHHPELGSSIQIGSPAWIAETTGRPVVADFRPRDLAAGGEGAPLAPFFHFAAMAEPGEARAVLNLGGIANLTWLPADGDAAGVRAFDVGPANSLVDGVVQVATAGRERMDRGGLRAARGRVIDGLLAELLDDEYLQRPPPKSTGRERYGRREAAALVERSKREGWTLDDLVATLVLQTARSVRMAADAFLAAAVGRLLVGGGGALNPTLMRALASEFPGAAVEPFDAVGVPADSAEAMAFSLLGRNALLGLTNHLPQTTGARRAAVLGAITPGNDGTR